MKFKFLLWIWALFSFIPLCQAVELIDSNLHIQTSPIGDLTRHYNLQVSHFFSPSFSLSFKGTRFVNKMTELYTRSVGWEVGARGNYYLPSLTTSIFAQKTLFGVHFGAYYGNFKQSKGGSPLILAPLPASQTVDQDEVDGAIYELMFGPLIPFDILKSKSLTLEILGGIQTYKANYFTYVTSTGARTVRQPSDWKLYPVIEINLGLYF